jgi:hypothetical protein
MHRSAGFLAAALTLVAGAASAQTTSSFTVSGAVATPGVDTAATLAGLTQGTETVTYTSAGHPVSDTYSGPTLWGVLQAAGGITPPAGKNGLLRDYVVATGSDGYEAVISAGEIAPNFGNKADLVATSDTGGQLPAPDGFARIIAAGDLAGGRYVSNLASLTVMQAPAIGGTGGGVTAAFTVGGGVATPLTETPGALAALPQHTETVTYHMGGTAVTDTYTGAYLWDVLNAAGIVTDAAIKNDILRKLVAVTGSDGYEVAFALGELSPKFGDAPILVALSDTAGQLGAGGADGFARIVVPGDILGGRYVSNIASMTVFDASAVPEPSGGAIVLGGVLALAPLRRPRRD